MQQESAMRVQSLDDSYVRIVSREEKLKRDRDLGKYPPAPAARRPVAATTWPTPPPVPKQPAPAKPVTHRLSKEEQEEQEAAQLAQCVQILEAVCVTTLCDPAKVRQGQVQSEYLHIRTRQITAYVAREYVPKPIPFKIIASAMGLHSPMGASKGHTKFKTDLATKKHVERNFAGILSQLREKGLVSPSQP